MQSRGRLKGGLLAATLEHARLEAVRHLRGDGPDPEVAQLGRLLRVSDDMMGELEQQNLAGTDKLPGAMRLRLMLLCGSAPNKFLHRGHDLRTPTDAIDLLFEIQETLFSIRRRRTTEFPPGWWRDPQEQLAGQGSERAEGDTTPPHP